MENNTQQPLNTNFNQPNLNMPDQQFQPNLDPKPKKSKKKYILTLIFVLLLVSGVVFAYLTFFKKDAVAPSTSTATQTEQPKPTGPISLVYGLHDTSKPLLLKTLTLADNKTTDFDTKDYSTVQHSSVHGEQIAVTVTSKSEKPTHAIFYSKDHGITYQKVYETKPPTRASLGDQITDLKFSSDGSSIIFGLLPQDSNKNVVSELKPESKEIKELFTSDTAGIFINAYNKDKQVIYRKGCFNCDGGPEPKIYSYDIATKKELAIISSNNTIESVAVKNDLTTLIYVDVPTKASSEALGRINTGPYTIKSFDFKTAQTTDIKTLGEANKPINILVGYTVNKNPYFTDGNKIYGVSSDNKITELFNSTKPIVGIHYISPDIIYVNLGNKETFSVEKFTVNDQKMTTILENTTNTDIFGITSNN